jgi:hypothetical protein
LYVQLEMHHSVVEGANPVNARNLAHTHFSMIDAFQIRSKKIIARPLTVREGRSYGNIRYWKYT